MKNKRLLKTCFYFGILVLLAITASLAWFYTAKDADLNEIMFVSANAPNTEISLDGGETYHKDTTLTFPGAINTPVSGTGFLIDGAVDLWRPTSIYEDSGAPVIDSEGNYKLVRDLKVYKNYYEFEVIIRSSLQTYICLGEESSIEPLDLSERKNKLYNNLPADYIAGAVRMSISQVYEDGDTQTEVAKKVWIPNSSYEFAYVSGIPGVMTNSKIIEDYKYYNGESFVDITEDFTNQLPISLGQMEEKEDGFYSKYIIRVWIEGSDREAVTELSGGMFKVRLSFVAREDEEND